MRDLIRRPEPIQMVLHIGLHARIIHLAWTAASQSPFVRFALSLLRAITAPTCIPLQFWANGARMPPQDSGDFRLPFAFHPQPI